MSRLTPLLLLLVAIFVQLQPALAANYAVGACLPNLQSYPTISLAVAGVPPGSTIMICPGNYPEQVKITDSVNLQGVVSGNAANPVITVPGGGLVQNTTFGYGFGIAAQVLVQNPSAVNISNIAVDGTGHGVSGCSMYVVGIYYQNASGTVNHVSTRNQTGGCGTGILAENISAANQAVTVENSSLHDFDDVAIYAFSDAPPQHLTIMSNSIVGSNQFAAPSMFFGWGVFLSSPATITGNVISDVYQGIWACCVSGYSITKNTIQDTSNAAIYSYFNDAATITSNNLFRNQTGVNLYSSSNSVVQKNTISDSPSSSGPGVGVEVNCAGTNNTITSNTFSDVGTALNNIPLSGTDITTPNFNFNVTVVKTTC